MHLTKARGLRNMTIATRSVVSRDAAAQKQQIEDWLNDGSIEDATTENDRSALQGYCELTRGEFEYI